MAVSKLSMLLVLFLVLVVSSISSQTQQVHSRLNQFNKILMDKGFGDMSEMIVSLKAILFPDLEVLESENKTYTVFAPGFPSFWARSNDDPPLSLIQYHIVHFKVDTDILESPSMVEHKPETLHQGHPLVVTLTVMPEGWTLLPSLNSVPIVERNVYNDGHLIVHRMPGFSHQDYYNSRYPCFDGPEAPTVSPGVLEVSVGRISSHRSQEAFSFLYLVSFLVGLVSLFSQY